MHVGIEYMAVILILIVVIGLSSWGTLGIQSSLIHVREEQLETVAAKLMDKMLLTLGYPEDWGLDPNINYYNLSGFKGFGLASGEKRGDLYLLDPSKITRLANPENNPLYVPPEHVSELLGIKGKYGFRLAMAPAINLTITPTRFTKVKGQDMACAFNITAENYLGARLFDVNIGAYYYYVNIYEKKGDYVVEVTSFNHVSNMGWQGFIDIDFEADLKGIGKGAVAFQACFLVAIGDLAGIRAIGTWPANMIDMTLMGEYLIVGFPIELLPRGAIHSKCVLDVAPPVAFEVGIKNSSNGEAAWILNRGGKSVRVYELDWVEPCTYLISLVGKKEGKFFVSFAPRIPNIDYGTGDQGPKTAVIYRLAAIDDYTYVIRLSVWRMQE